jgi:hypothetical protein
LGGSHWLMLSPAGTILAVAAGGADEVFAITSDHNLWEHRLTGWALLSAGDFQSVSASETAAGQGEALGTLADTSLWEYDPDFANPDHWRIQVPSGVAASAAPRRRFVHA